MDHKSFEIERNIPLPADLPRNRKVRLYPFDKMEVGDSFFLPADETEIKHVASNLACSASQWKRKHKGYNFTQRILETGVRIWRISAFPET